MPKTQNAGSTYNGGILGRRKRLPPTLGGLSQTPRKSSLSADAGLQRPRISGGTAARRLIAYPEYRSVSKRPAVVARYERELIGSIVDRTCPVLLDRDEAQTALDIGPGVLDRWVREDKIEDMVCVGERQLFRAAQIRELILVARP